MSQRSKRKYTSSTRAQDSHHENRHPLIEVEKHGETTWINIQDGQPSEVSEIAEKYNIHALHIHPVLNSVQLSQMITEEKYLFVLLSQPYALGIEDKIRTKPIAIYMGKNFLITIHSSKTPTPKLLFDELKQLHSPENNSPARIVYHLINRLLLDIQSQIENVSVQLDHIESKVFDNVNSDVVEIGRLRQKIIRLRRCLAGQKTVLEELHESINKFSQDDLRRYYASNTNMSRRLWETIEEAKETVEVYKDVDFTSNTERTNEILAILTIIFTLAIPGTLFGTFYGMNIILPGGTNGQHHLWTFFGPYTTLIVIVAISLIAALAMYVWFKKRKWF